MLLFLNSPLDHYYSSATTPTGPCGPRLAAAHPRPAGTACQLSRPRSQTYCCPGPSGGRGALPPGPVHAKPRRARPAAPARVRCTRVGCTGVHQQEADSSPLHAGGRLSAPEETTGSEGCHSRRYCPDARPRATEMREGELAGPRGVEFLHSKGSHQRNGKAAH